MVTEEHHHGIAVGALTLATVAFVQGPVRIAAYALVLRHLRRTSPELFDGSACVAAISACLDEYQREVLG